MQRANSVLLELDEGEMIPLRPLPSDLSFCEQGLALPSQTLERFVLVFNLRSPRSRLPRCAEAPTEEESNYDLHQLCPREGQE